MNNEKMKQAQVDWNAAYDTCMFLANKMQMLDVEDPLYGELLAEFAKVHGRQRDAGIRIKRLSEVLLAEMDAALKETMQP